MTVRLRASGIARLVLTTAFCMALCPCAAFAARGTTCAPGEVTLGSGCSLATPAMLEPRTAQGRARAVAVIGALLLLRAAWSLYRRGGRRDTPAS